ncbi:alkaline phosphatase D family protein [Marinobacter fonticola]|uniref:alkaline phosphatase D family protein n=1 Tax=Marinobacter fonticola TaxID=2603215 RepID=UPI0011E62135|nr:alkaline phosphatase D family protein [Marinobacter fonticola]
MQRLTRREFLRISALTAGTVAISTGLSGCFSSDSDSDSDNDRAVGFQHGVASGDPLQNRVLLWTRITPDDDDSSDIPVGWEVATDAEFSNLVHSGDTMARAANDYTVKVDVLDLQAGQTYYYRFKSEGDTVSPAGLTRTLPEGAVSQVRLAVLSCSNYPAGYFNVYAAAAQEAELDAVVHLGDYIYEYEQGGYASGDAEALGRTLPADNDTELLTLTDYRKRYALYHTDTDLQALHAAAPFIAVWDDHEVANDAWEDGAENHTPGEEGDFTARKTAALQAYFEWMPVRPASEDDQQTIYRSFQFGNLVSLYMLDTRIIGRDEQLSYANYLTGDPENPINAAQFEEDVTNPNRTLLGAEQLAWLQNQMATSTATWQVLGQQVLMGRMTLPAELLLSIQNPDPEVLLPLFEELATIKARMLANDPTLTPEERARLDAELPYNLDAWDGYYHEREVVLASVRELDKNLVVLAGDTHNAWGNDLKDMAGNAVGVEFATASVTSPGLEDYLGLPEDAVPGAEEALQTLIDDLQYTNINQRGYLLITLTLNEARADWRYVDTIKATSYSLDASRRMSLKTTPATRQIQAVS